MKGQKDGNEDRAIIKILTITLLLYCFYLHKSNEKFIFSSSSSRVSWGWAVFSFFMASTGLLSDIKTTSRQRENILTCQIFYSLSKFLQSGLFPILRRRGGSQSTDVYGSRNILNMAKEVDEWKVKYILQSWNTITRLMHLRFVNIKMFFNLIFSGRPLL